MAFKCGFAESKEAIIVHRHIVFQSHLPSDTFSTAVLPIRITTWKVAVPLRVSRTTNGVLLIGQHLGPMRSKDATIVCTSLKSTPDPNAAFPVYGESKTAHAESPCAELST